MLAKTLSENLWAADFPCALQLEKEPSPMNRTLVALVAGASLTFFVGCSTKNYVRKEVTPVIDKTNELDELTARNTRDIRDVDNRAQQGIQGVTTKASEADQKALAAGQ